MRLLPRRWHGAERRLQSERCSLPEAPALAPVISSPTRSGSAVHHFIWPVRKLIQQWLLASSASLTRPSAASVFAHLAFKVIKRKRTKGALCLCAAGRLRPSLRWIRLSGSSPEGRTRKRAHGHRASAAGWFQRLPGRVCPCRRRSRKPPRVLPSGTDVADDPVWCRSQRCNNVADAELGQSHHIHVTFDHQQALQRPYRFTCLRSP